MAHAATCDTWTHAVLQIRCRSAHHRLRQRKMAPQIVTEGHKPQRIRIGTRKCVISRPCLSHGRLHISRQSTLRVLPGATHSRAVTGPARRYPHRRGAFALASWVVRRCRRAVRSKFKRRWAALRVGVRFVVRPSIAGPVEWAGAEWGIGMAHVSSPRNGTKVFGFGVPTLHTYHCRPRSGSTTRSASQRRLRCPYAYRRESRAHSPRRGEQH